MYKYQQSLERIFVKRTNVKKIPPTKAALKQHVKRAVYQVGYVWGQLLITTPSPTSWRWMKTADNFLSQNGLCFQKLLRPAMN